ncbi:MAG: cobalamin-dependent protein [Spirochaetales bacterium]|nr:cobalamin-dependent protein [Spirochaetales bacterium]
MHAVIAVPPVRDFYFTPHRFANLGVEVVSGILRGSGFSVTVFNFPLTKNKSKHVPLPAELAYLKPFIIPNEAGRLSFFKTYQHFGPSFTECALQIKDAGPDIIFISCFAFSYAQETLLLATEIKRLLPQIKIAAGGAGVSAHPHYFLKGGEIDYCIAGEAEISLSCFLKHFAAGARSTDLLTVPNLFFIQNNTIQSSETKLFTASDDLDFHIKKSFETKKAVYYSLCLSRGCSKRCRFCSLHLCHGRRFRTVPIEKVISGIKNIAPEIKNHGKQIRINFEDDNLLLAPNYFLKVLATIRSNIPRAVFCAENGLDYTLLNAEILETLIESGFIQFNLSLGSADENSAHYEYRDFNPSLFEKLLQVMHLNNLDCISYFICGLKGDNVHTIAHTLAYLANLPTLIGISFFYAIPGIQDYTDRSLFNSLPPTLCKSTSAYPWNNSLSPKTMVTAFRLSRLINMLKSTRNPAEENLIRLILKEKRLYTLIKRKERITPYKVPVLDDELVSQFFKLFAYN